MHTLHLPLVCFPECCYSSSWYISESIATINTIAFFILIVLSHFMLLLDIVYWDRNLVPLQENLVRWVKKVVAYVMYRIQHA